MPAGPAAFGWRWLFPIVSILAAVAVPLLALAASDAVLDSRGGIEVGGERVDDPAAPGYLAFVVASPTAIVFDLDDSGELVGAAFIGLAGESGGSVLVVPAELSVEPEEGQAETLALAYGSGGVDRAVRGFERLLGVSVDRTFLVDGAERAAAMESVLPLDYSLPTALRDADGELIFERGRLALDTDATLAVVTTLGPDENGFIRADRQHALWQEWIEQYDEPADLAPGEIDTLEEHVAVLADGIHRVDIMPVEPYQLGEGRPFYGGDEDFARALVEEVVVFPELFEDTRPRVRVENGTTDQSLHTVAAEAVESGGGRLVVISNAFTLDVEETVIEVHNPAYESAAHEIAERLGDARVELVDVDEPDVDLFVLIGADLTGPAA